MYAGGIRKLITELNAENQAVYHLPIGEHKILLNEYIGQNIQLKFAGKINCIACQRSIKKTFNQGYCFPCVKTLAACDICIVRPELCHHHLGTCREPEWGLTNCMQPHVVYLSNSSSLKVGITRLSNIPSRWIDQGAIQALALMQVKSRYISGLVEVMCKKTLNDRTNWRQMLKEDPAPIDLEANRVSILKQISPELEVLQQAHGQDAYTYAQSKEVTIQYPVLAYPSTIKSLNFDKTPSISGPLVGIKGQYLILEGGVLNMRKFAGYYLEFE